MGDLREEEDYYSDSPVIEIVEPYFDEDTAENAEVIQFRFGTWWVDSAKATSTCSEWNSISDEHHKQG